MVPAYHADFIISKFDMIFRGNRPLSARCHAVAIIAAPFPFAVRTTAGCLLPISYHAVAGCQAAGQNNSKIVATPYGVISYVKISETVL